MRSGAFGPLASGVIAVNSPAVLGTPVYTRVGRGETRVPLDGQDSQQGRHGLERVSPSKAWLLAFSYLSAWLLAFRCPDLLWPRRNTPPAKPYRRRRSETGHPRPMAASCGQLVVPSYLDILAALEHCLLRADPANDIVTPEQQQASVSAVGGAGVTQPCFDGFDPLECQAVLYDEASTLSYRLRLDGMPASGDRLALAVREVDAESSFRRAAQVAIGRAVFAEQYCRRRLASMSARGGQAQAEAGTGDAVAARRRLSQAFVAHFKTFVARGRSTDKLGYDSSKKACWARAAGAQPAQRRRHGEEALQDSRSRSRRRRHVGCTRR